MAATVTAIIYSVTLDNGDGIAFGSVGVGSSANTTTGGTHDTTTATNNGSVSEKLSIKASNSTGGAGWTMAAAAGSETYTMESCIANCDASPTWNAFGANENTYATLAASVGVGLTQPFDLQIKPPTDTTVTAQQSITVTVMAGAL